MMGKFCGNCFNNTLNEQNICTLCGFDGGYNRRLAPHALPAGAILNGRYIIGRILGQGGFGITYTARDHQTGELVAVKEFYPDSMVTRTDLTEVTPFLGERGENFAYGKETFLQEAETMAQFIGNPNIVRVYSYFEENGTAYFVMEYVDGVSYLDHLKQKGGKIGFDDALKILLPVMDALSAVHEKNIIHRDVTPDNIYISKDGTVKLLDFGAARYSLGNASRSLDVILKHGFAPREQYKRRGRQGPYTDVYSLGATLYYSVTGIRPDDALERVDEDLVALPSTLGIPISMEQESALMKAMAVDPENRYQTMAEFRDVLMRAKPVAKPEKKDEPPKAAEKQKPVPAKKTKQKKKASRLIPAAAALICIAAAIFVFGRKSDSPALSSEPTQAPETQQAVPTVTPDVIPETVPLSPEAIAYNEAVDLFYQGEYGKAAIAFGKLGDFRDAREISFQIWDTIAERDIITANGTIFGIKSDSTLCARGKNTYGQCNVEGYSDVIALSDTNYTYILKSDHTVTHVELAVKYNHPDCSNLKDIVSIQAVYNGVVGLKADGAIVTTADWIQEDLYQDCVMLEALGRYSECTLVALKSDGTVIGLDAAKDWTDIVSIQSMGEYLLGFKKDGTVLQTPNLADWKPEFSAEELKDAISAADGNTHILALKLDGTVIATGDNTSHQCDVEDWTDIVAVYAQSGVSIGLKSDGTVVHAGTTVYGFGMISKWTDMKLPADRDALLSQIKPQHITSENTPEDIPSGVTPAGLGAEETAYNEAVRLFKNGEYGKAAIAFGKLGDFQDAQEISFKIWDAIAVRDSIENGYYHTAGLKTDGTAVAVGTFSDGRADVDTWTDVAAISVSDFNTAALFKDGTVSVKGYNGYGVCDVQDWKSIVQIQSTSFTIGLKADGTIVVTGDKERNKAIFAEYAKWTDIVAVYGSFGLKADGTVVHPKSDNYDLSSWSDIIDLCCGNSHIIGLKENGTVIMECMHGVKVPCNCDVSGWTDIISVSAGAKHILGLKSDGTVVATGSNSNKQCNVSNWKDIAAIKAGNSYSSFGIKKDGTVVTTGIVKLGNVIRDEWNDIKLPVDRDTLLSQIHLDYIT